MNLIYVIVYVADCEVFCSISQNFPLGMGIKWLVFPFTCLNVLHAGDNYWGGWGCKNRVIHVLPLFYSPEPRQYIVSAGQIVFVLDKKPAVQSLFHKTEFQHCH